MKKLLAGLILLFPLLLQAAIGTYTFETPEQEVRFNRLSQELRCLVCQNQNIADSNAGLAVDLRRQLHEMIVADKTDAEIIDFMTQRYGDFVLYRPPLKASTILLWVGPFALLLLATGTFAWFIRRRVAGSTEAPLDAAEQARLLVLTGEGENVK